MLPKKNRLTHREVLAVIRYNKIIHSPFLQLKYLPNQLPYSRFSVIISSRVSKSAVKRNRLRRRIYSSLLSFSPGLDILIYPNAQMLKCSNDQINSSLHSGLSNIS